MMDGRFRLLTFFSIITVSCCHITDLMYSCSGADDERCRFTAQDYTTFYSPAYKVRLFNLMSTGIPHIFWSRVGADANFTNDISLPCIAGLEHWKQRMLSGEKEALAMIDSSGKFPTSSMLKTSTALGDYDQCLAIESAQFCSIELFPKQARKSIWTSDFYSLDQRVMAQDAGFVQGLCLPADGCSIREIRSLVHQIMKPYLMTAEPGFLTCDTQHSISWASILSSFSSMQWISLMYLILMIWFIAFATGLHALQLMTDFKVPALLEQLTIFSAIDSAERIFFVKKSYFEDSRRVILDIFKAISVSFTAVSHSYCILGLPLGFFLFDKQETFSWFMRQPFAQSMANEAGLGIFMAFSGFTSFKLMYPMAKAKKLPFFLAFIDRLIKFLPAMAAIVSVELIWPILGSGPLYTQVAQFNVKRCYNGWTNLLFINNWIDCIEICALQTFFASLVMQLFLISLIVTKVLIRNEKMGIRLSWFLIVGSGLWMAFNAWRYNVTPTIFNYYPKTQDSVDHGSAIHAHFASSCFPYFAGFLSGYYIVEKGVTIDVTDWRRKIKWLVVMTLLSSISNCLMIANAADLVDRKYSAIFILLNRGSLTASGSVLLFYLYSVTDFTLIQKVIGNRKSGDHYSPTPDEKTFSLLSAFHRLALGIFFTNMSVIHYEIFTRRRLITFDIISVLSRSLFTLVSVLFASFLLTIVFIHPVEQLMSALLASKDKKRLKSS